MRGACLQGFHVYDILWPSSDFNPPNQAPAFFVSRNPNPNLSAPNSMLYSLKHTQSPKPVAVGRFAFLVLLIVGFFLANNLHQLVNLNPNPEPSNPNPKSETGLRPNLPKLYTPYPSTLTQVSKRSVYARGNALSLSTSRSLANLPGSGFRVSVSGFGILLR